MKYCSFLIELSKTVYRKSVTYYFHYELFNSECFKIVFDNINISYFTNL